MMTTVDTNLQGVIAIMTSPDGHVIATVADFDRDSYGGFKLWEAQRLRVRQKILWATVKAYSSSALTECLSSYLIEQIGRELIGGRNEKGKHKLTLRSIGWPDDVREEMRAPTGISSKSGISRLVSALEEKGFIRRLHRRARSIEVIREPFSVPSSKAAST